MFLSPQYTGPLVRAGYGTGGRGIGLAQPVVDGRQLWHILGGGPVLEDLPEVSTGQYAADLGLEQNVADTTPSFAFNLLDLGGMEWPTLPPADPPPVLTTGPGIGGLVSPQAWPAVSPSPLQEAQNRLVNGPGGVVVGGVGVDFSTPLQVVDTASGGMVRRAAAVDHQHKLGVTPNTRLLWTDPGGGAPKTLGIDPAIAGVNLLWDGTFHTLSLAFVAPFGSTAGNALKLNVGPGLTVGGSGYLEVDNYIPPLDGLTMSTYGAAPPRLSTAGVTASTVDGGADIVINDGDGIHTHTFRLIRGVVAGYTYA